MKNLPEWIEKKIEKNRGVKENVTPTVTPVTPVTKAVSCCNKKDKSVTANVTLPSHPTVTPIKKDVSSLSKSTHQPGYLKPSRYILFPEPSREVNCSTCPACDKGRKMCHGKSYYSGKAARGVPVREAVKDCPRLL